MDKAEQRIATIVGNPRPDSRTHALAGTLADAIAADGGGVVVPGADLAVLGARAFDRANAEAVAATERILAADVLVVASPTFKATYSGLLKVFLDRVGTGALAGTRAVPLMLGGGAQHQLAVDVHLTPLLLELGASVPARGLFVLESDVDDFAGVATGWAGEHRGVLRG